MKNRLWGKVVSILAVFMLLVAFCGCGKRSVGIGVSVDQVKLAVGAEKKVTIENYDDLENVEVEIDDDDVVETRIKNGKIRISGKEEGVTTITVTASNSDSKVNIKVVVEGTEVDASEVSEQASETTVQVPEATEQSMEEVKTKVSGQIKVDATEMEIGLNFLTGTYFHTTILNYDSSWTNLSVTKSENGIVAAWIDDNDPSHIDISPVAQGVVTLTVSADGMEPANIEVTVVKGVGQIGEHDPHWSSSSGCKYAGRLASASTYWDIWTLDGFSLGSGRQSKDSLVFYTSKNKLGYNYEYRVNGSLRYDLSIYLGMHGEEVSRPNSYEEYLKLYAEDERLHESFDDSEESYREYLELLDEYLKYASGSGLPEDYFDGFVWEVTDTGYYAPDGESPLYFGKRICPNDPDGDTETYIIYFEYEDTVHGVTNYVTVEFNKFTWEGLVKDAKGIRKSQEQAEMEVIVNSASRIFNYVAHDRSAWDF